MKIMGVYQVPTKADMSTGQLLLGWAYFNMFHIQMGRSSKSRRTCVEQKYKSDPEGSSIVSKHKGKTGNI
jgi:hypothetical protein